METFLEILKYILPALIVLLTAYLIIRNFTDIEQKRRILELKKSSQQFTINLRLQAYERLILFLERNHPGQLVIRVHSPNLSTDQFKTQLIRTVREEYEHNLSQQVYISDEAWSLVVNAKEELIKVINTAAIEIREEPTSTGLAKQVIEKWINHEKDPIAVAKTVLKNEAKMLF